MKKSEFIQAPLGIRIDFHEGAHVIFPPGTRKFHLRVTSQANGESVFNAEIQCHPDQPMEFKTRQRYYIPWEIEIKSGDFTVYRHRLNLTGREVCVNLAPGTLGDMIAWLPAVQNFRRERNCVLTVMMRAAYIEMFESAYPDIRFISPENFNPDRYYAICPVAVEGYGNFDFSPADFQQVNLMDYAAITLGVPPDHKAPALAAATRNCREEYGRYVCIATRASRKMKQWNHPGAWEKVTEFLQQNGYRVFCIDADNEAMPPNAEDFTGMKPLRERIDLIRGGEFFIGLASGLSWISWACGKPTVLISGFSMEFVEFPTPYRIIDKTVCHGCFNNGDMRFNEFDKCPRNNGYECTVAITPEQVIATINAIPEFQQSN